MFRRNFQPVQVAEGRVRMTCELIDLATGLLPVIEANLHKSFDEQIAEWQKFYAGSAPALPGRLYRDYADVAGGWLAIAREKVWPHLAERMDRMWTASRSIRAVHQDIHGRAVQSLGYTDALVIVSYVGIGNGAGWATQWEGRPAVLLGLEKIAELNWHNEPEVRKVLAHEIGHLFMMSIRGDIEKLGEDPLLCLYEEGFAQHCEHVMLGKETWGCASQSGWLEWCLSQEDYLARRYVREMHDREAWRRFYGDWFEIDGWRQTGYFLGCKLVQRLAGTHELRALAAMGEDQIKAAVLDYLRR